MADDIRKEAGESDRVSEPHEAYEVIVKKASNEIVIKDASSGQTVTLRGKLDIADDEDELEELKPLTPMEFRSALERLNSLGLTWTADRLPRIKSRNAVADDAMFTEEFLQLQSEYPHLPSELAIIIPNAITGAKVPDARVGGPESLKAKADIVRELLITSEYKAEFFFKHSIKVPYLEDVDWEIVFKLAEKNVAGPPGVSYALLSLVYHHPSIGGGPRKHESITVAVDNDLVNKLLHNLNEVKKALEIGSKLTRKMHGMKIPTEGEHDDADTGQQKELG